VIFVNLRNKGLDCVDSDPLLRLFEGHQMAVRDRVGGCRPDDRQWRQNKLHCCRYDMCEFHPEEYRVGGGVLMI